MGKKNKQKKKKTRAQDKKQRRQFFIATKIRFNNYNFSVSHISNQQLKKNKWMNK